MGHLGRKKTSTTTISKRRSKPAAAGYHALATGSNALVKRLLFSDLGLQGVSVPEITIVLGGGFYRRLSIIATKPSVGHFGYEADQQIAAIEHPSEKQ